MREVLQVSGTWLMTHKPLWAKESRPFEVKGQGNAGMKLGVRLSSVWLWLDSCSPSLSLSLSLSPLSLPPSLSFSLLLFEYENMWNIIFPLYNRTRVGKQSLVVTEINFKLSFTAWKPLWTEWKKKWRTLSVVCDSHGSYEKILWLRGCDLEMENMWTVVVCPCKS